MGGESSNSGVESGGGTGMGSQTLLVSISGAHLFLIDGEESVLMQSGEFALKLLKQTHSPLAVVVANVGEVQWPVGKDAPVLKLWNRRYTFALPGLVYGLILPDSASLEVLQRLEGVLYQYCTFEIHQEIANSAQQHMDYAEGTDVAGYWTAVASDVETLSSRVARQICSTSTVVANSIVIGGEWATLGIQQGGSLLKRKVPDSSSSSDGGVSPRMMKRMQQARRMSAVAKLMSKTLLKGAISATGHVSRSLGLDVNAMAPAPAPTSGAEGGMRDVAVASVDAFGKVVEAVETAGKSMYGVTTSVGADLIQQRFGSQVGQVVQDSFGAVGNVFNTAWTLNKMGVKMLLQVTAASTALSARSNTRVAVTNLSAEQRVSSSESDVSMLPPAGSDAPRLPPSQSTPLFHQITLSPSRLQEPTPLNLLPSEPVQSAPLQMSQLFPMTPDRAQSAGMFSPPSLQPTLNSFMPPGNYTSSLPPGPRPNSPFQQYTRQVNQQPPYNFPYGIDSSRKS